MPDLGRYAVSVLGAYGLTFLLIGGLIGLSVWQAVRMRRKLAAVERRVRP